MQNQDDTKEEKPFNIVLPPSKAQVLRAMVESLAGSLVRRGTNIAPTEALLELAETAYQKGVDDVQLHDTGRVSTVGPAVETIVERVNEAAHASGMTATLLPSVHGIRVELYRLLSDVYSQAKGHTNGLVFDVRERAEVLLQSFEETSLTQGFGQPKPLLSFLRELFVNALLEARETQHVVDWSNPAQVELYTIAVEAESTRYEAINLKIAAAEKAERNPFADVALQAIPNWFDERRPCDQGSPDETPRYLAAQDPLFVSALNRAFSIGVMSAQPQEGAGFQTSVHTDKALELAQNFVEVAFNYAKAKGHEVFKLLVPKQGD